MPEFKVNPDQLAAGRGHNDMVAGTIGGTAGPLRAAASSVADAAGHPGASAAGVDWGSPLGGPARGQRGGHPPHR
jgi:hypothetical protein